MIFDLFKNSLNKVLKTPSVTFYFVLYLIIINFLAYYMTTPHTKYVLIVLALTTVVFSFAFVSGWFQIIKEVAQEKEPKEKNYFSSFLEGVGKNIIPVGIGTILYSIVWISIIVATSALASVVFGDLNSIVKDMFLSAQGVNNINEFLNNLTDNQKYVLYTWQLSFMLVSAVFNFIMIYYFPAIINSKVKNPFIKPFGSVIESICFLFRNFLNSFIIFILIYVFYAFLGILNAFGSNYPILSVITLFIWIYFISIAVVVVFNYYEQKNLCSDGPDSIGENKCLDTTGKDN